MRAVPLLAVLIVIALSWTACTASPPTSSPTAAENVTPIARASTTSLTVGGPFAAGATMDKKFTCDDADNSPALHWSGAPASVRSYAVLCVDTDAPGGDFIHWVLYDLAPAATQLAEGLPTSATLGNGARQGGNDFGKVGYGGPCPPAGKPHHYHFRVYALDMKLQLADGARAADLTAAMQGHILAQGELVGVYGR